MGWSGIGAKEDRIGSCKVEFLATDGFFTFSFSVCIEVYGLVSNQTLFTLALVL